jgi:phospholipid/cholesterol/gamma-HCH transport system substrate-binding protein
VFPELIKQMNASQAQLDYLREFTPDVVAALTNLGQAAAYYDANGHYTRTQPVFGAFRLDGANQLQTWPSQSMRYNGLHVVRSRCPGTAVQPTPDGSAPVHVPGCNPANTPPGP